MKNFLVVPIAVVVIVSGALLGAAYAQEHNHAAPAKAPAAKSAPAVRQAAAVEHAPVEEVNRWFAIGVNPQINQLLAATASARATK